ncbi:MAG: FHA domain-containing protein [Lachnospiraceae bacterium]|nr:FHA domain-containing protein [Lachnospiraceae bacterium]
MAIGYKNLILIDNSRSVGDVNFELAKETAKYICSSKDQADEVRIAVFGEDISYLTDYTDDTEALVAAVDGLELEDRDTYITDNLVSILEEWRDQDVACRNIILFTDGQEEESLLHANEELYYMLTDLSYPVYVVQSVETRNDTPSKNLSAIATMSKGRLLLTEFEGSDGGSEKIMGDTILNAINEARQKAAEETETEGTGATEAATEVEDVDRLVEDTGLSDSTDNDEAMFIASDSNEEKEYTQEASTPIIVNNKDNAPTIGFSVIFPAIGLLFAIVFAIVIYLITHSNDRVKKKDLRALRDFKYDLSDMAYEAKIAEDAEDVDCMTYRLNEDDNATRILADEESGYNIVLEDCKDPTRIFRAGGSENLIVGRSRGLCDIVIDHDDSVSGRHCELNVIDGNWYVRDLKSSNGTRVNSQKVFQEFMLKNGDILKLGQSEFLVTV